MAFRYILAKGVYALCLITVGLFTACGGGVSNPNKNITLDSFSELRAEKFILNSEEIRNNIKILIESDGISMQSDKFVHNYYLNDNPFIWISRLGVYDRADSLIGFIRKANTYGISLRFLKSDEIRKDFECMRTLGISDVRDEDINVIMARLEYNLSKAYLRYLGGIRFGFVNPDYLYNNFEKNEEDSTSTQYRQLSELHVQRPNNRFYRDAINSAFNDSIGHLLSSIHPRNDLYLKLLSRLNGTQLSGDERAKTICNIERCRWRLNGLSNENDADGKYVEVNIPSFSLRAIDGENALLMRTGCGTVKHKTPLLTSKITRMDVNPQWIVPKSISKGFFDDYDYMHRMGMFVFDKKKGKLPPEEAEYEKIINGEQYIIQAGGPKNSLGRIIFRFDNSFSVFLHDTSSPWVFKRDCRAVSHGCVRVEKPYELALFMIGKDDEELADRLKYSMTVDFINDRDSLAKRGINSKRLVSSIPVRPAVPLFITYYTIYYGSNGQLADYQDIYGYDEALEEKLKPFMN